MSFRSCSGVAEVGARVRVGEQVLVEPLGEAAGVLGEGVAQLADVLGVGLGDSQERLAAAAFRLVHPVALSETAYATSA